MNQQGRFMLNPSTNIIHKLRPLVFPVEGFMRAVVVSRLSIPIRRPRGKTRGRFSALHGAFFPVEPGDELEEFRSVRQDLFVLGREKVRF